jgi:hypothetical protein
MLVWLHDGSDDYAGFTQSNTTACWHGLPTSHGRCAACSMWPPIIVKNDICSQPEQGGAPRCWCTQGAPNFFCPMWQFDGKGKRVKSYAKIRY